MFASNTKTNEINGIKIFRFEGPLYFANADYFMEKLLKKTGVSTELLKAENDANQDDGKVGNNRSTRQSICY